MFDVLKAQKRRPAMKKISTMQAFSNEIFWGCDLAGETPGRVNRRRKSAKKETGICERCWCKKCLTLWDNLNS